MMHAGLFATAVLLGLFVLAGGGYGILYATSMLHSSALLGRAGYACYALQLLIALAVCVNSPLHPLWKVLVGVSGIAYGFIPPVMWRLLETMHRREVA